MFLFSCALRNRLLLKFRYLCSFARRHLIAGTVYGIYGLFDRFFYFNWFCVTYEACAMVRSTNITSNGNLESALSFLCRVFIETGNIFTINAYRQIETHKNWCHVWFPFRINHSGSHSYHYIPFCWRLFTMIFVSIQSNSRH